MFKTCTVAPRRAQVLARLALAFNLSVGLAVAEEAEADTETASAEDAGSESARAPAVDETELATARLHFANGVELLQSSPPNYQDAYRQFQLALEKSGGSWKVRGNLGLCALKLERDGEALVHYSEYLEKGGEEVDPQERSHIERELLLLKGNLTTVMVESSDPEARISVTRQGSTSPTQLYTLEEGKAALGLRSGSFTIVAKSGEKRLEWSAVLSAGETSTHVFDFDAAEAEEAVSAPETTATPEEGQKSKPSTLRLIGFGTAGAGVAALGGGLIVGILSQSKEKTALEDCISDVCPEATEGDLDSAKSMATVANILLISGGVLAATGVTLIIVGGNEPSGETAHMSWTGRPKTTPARLSLSPMAALAGGGLLASGHF